LVSELLNQLLEFIAFGTRNPQQFFTKQSCPSHIFLEAWFLVPLLIHFKTTSSNELFVLACPLHTADHLVMHPLSILSRYIRRAKVFLEHLKVRIASLRTSLLCTLLALDGFSDEFAANALLDAL